MNKKNWFYLFLKLEYSVIPAILDKVFFCAFFGVLISVLYYFNFPVSLPILSSLVPSIVLGLLLVFRTNTAYERFWEGRKLWGVLVNTVRNLSRTIWVTVVENSAGDREEKIKALHLLVAFAVATKLHLRGEKVNLELSHLVDSKCFENLKKINHPPLEIAFLIGDYLQKQYEKKSLNKYQLTSMFKLLDTMVDSLGGCERILRTPIPLAYSIHLKQLIFIYCLTLPFQVVNELHWWTGFIVGIISFTIFGIEAIGLEIENPFGYDANDLPLDNICQTMERNIDDLITLTPTVKYW
jgi:putative membrane protein